jgi:hypothetical protein
MNRISRCTAAIAALLGSLASGCGGDASTGLEAVDAADLSTAALCLSPAHLTVLPDQAVNGQSEIMLTIENSGRQRAKVLKIDATCDCTVAGNPKPYEIAPGERAVVPVRAQMPHSGTSESRIDVKVQVGRRVNTLSSALTLVGQTANEPKIIRQPRIVDLRYDADDRSPEARFLIMTFEAPGSAPWLHPIQFESDALTVDARLADERQFKDGRLRRTYECTASLHDAAIASHVQEFIPQTLTPPRERPAAIFVRVQRRPSVQCVPDELSFAIDPTGAAIMQRDLFVFRPDDADWPITVAGLNSTVQWLRIEEAVPKTAASEALAHFRVFVDSRHPELLNGQPHTTSLQLVLKAPREETVRIPATVLLAPPE